MSVPDELNRIVQEARSRQLGGYSTLNKEEGPERRQDPGVLLYSTGGDTVPESLTEAEQIALMRHQLAEKDQAILQATIGRTELERELDETRRAADKIKEESAADKAQLQSALHQYRSNSGSSDQAPRTEAKAGQDALDEIARLKTEFFRAQKAIERERRTHSAELSKYRQQAQEVQNELEKENRARRLEAAQASAKIATLTKDLSEVVESGGRSATAQTQKRAKGNFRLLAGGLIAAAILGAFVVRTQSAAHAAAAPGSPVSQKAESSSLEPGKLTQLVSTSQGSQNPGTEIHDSKGAMAVPIPMALSRFSPESKGSFAGSLSRLNRVLLNFPGRKPEEVLHAIHVAYAQTDPTMCSFEWNHGQPSLIYTPDGNKLSLGTTLTHCAEALEDFHQAKQ